MTTIITADQVQEMSEERKSAVLAWLVMRGYDINSVTAFEIDFPYVIVHVLDNDKETIRTSFPFGMAGVDLTDNQRRLIEGWEKTSA